MESRYQLHHGDCLEVLKMLPDCSVDAVVTDPPYGLSFMGKRWDYDVPAVEVWQECLRVLKPGGHLLAFAGTRTQHRMAVRIEDAGFEIRDLIAWVYSQGFPKGHDIAWEMHKKACVACGLMVEYDHENKSTAEKRGADTIREHGLRFVRASYLQTPVYACSECGQVLQPFLSEQDASELRAAWSKSKTVWPKQPCMERRGDLEKTKGELQRCQVCKMSSGFFADGAKGWIHNGASPCNGEIPWQVAEPNGSRPSYRPQSIEQLDRQPDAFRIERRAQEIRGFNTALKPAFEPVTMARKPLASTVAANVLEHGTGGLNVDGCRVGFVSSSDMESAAAAAQRACQDQNKNRTAYGNFDNGPASLQPYLEKIELGRWPANFIHDGSDKATVLLGDAARFFYTAKASKADRDAGCGIGSNWLDSLELILDNGDFVTIKEVSVWEIAGLEASTVLTGGVSRLRATFEDTASKQSVSDLSMSSSGSKQTDVFLMGIRFTTSTGTSKTIDLKTLSWLTHLPTNEYTADASKTIAEIGLSHAESAALQNLLKAITTSEETVFLLGASNAAKTTQQSTSVKEWLLNKSRRNIHSTVKPTDLMRYLCRLVTPPGGIVLDPFTGSGSTGKAAILEGFRFIGIEREAEYIEIARARIEREAERPRQPTLFD